MRYFIFAVFVMIFKVSVADIYASKTPKPTQYPSARINWIQEVFADRNQISYSNANQVNASRAYTYVRPTFNIDFHKYFGFETSWNIEDVNKNYRNPYAVSDYFNSSSKSGFFTGQGLIVEQAKIRVGNDRVSFYVGKINPLFGAGAFRYNNDTFDNNWYGVNGTFLNTGYELREKLGTSLDFYLIKIKNSAHKVSISAFKKDDSPLYDPLISQKNQLYYPNNSSGAPFGSYALNLRGHFDLDLFKEHLAYNLSYRQQGSKNTRDETGFSASLQYYIYPLENLKIGTFNEITRVFNYNSINDNTHRYLTYSLYANYKNFNLSLVINKFNATNYQNISVFSRDIAFGYDFKKGVGVYISKRILSNQNNTKMDSYMASIRYKLTLI